MATQTAVSYANRAEGFGIPGYRIDGNDVIASYTVTKHVMNQVRNGAGPALIEAVTYRLGPHTSSDDPTKYRSAEEYEHWQKLDPIPRLRAHLQYRGITDDMFDQIDVDNNTHAIDVRQRVLSLPDPRPAEMFDHVYSDPHPTMIEQKDWLTHYEASFEP